MFAYARNMQLALGDKLRRAGLTAGAGVFLLIGLGFLLAALWTWLAHHLGWGALGASLAIGSGFVAIGLILLLLARNERHPLPTPDELKTEVEAQVSGMADAAIARQKKLYPKMKMVGDKFPVSEDRNLARQATLDILQTYPKVKGMLIFGSQGGPGAGLALREKRLNGKIKMVAAGTPKKGTKTASRRRALRSGR